MGYIKGENRTQTILFPESIDDYIGEDNSVRIIEEYVELLDMEQLGFKKAVCSLTGRPPYNPKYLLKLYLYGYLNRIRSSRRLEHEATRNIEVIWLLKKLKPDFKTIADFRKDNKKALNLVFREFSKLCDEWELYGKELVAIDGSKFRACNSKSNNYSAKKLERNIKHIYEKIEQYMKELDNVDVAESCDRKPTAPEVENGITPYVTKQIYSNGTGDRDFYSEKFQYDKDKKIYICPAGKELYYCKNRTQKDKGVVGHEYRKYEACKNCEYKIRCTKSEKGRTICRHVDQDFLDTIDFAVELNMEKYKLRQMIVEHPFGTIKRSLGAYFIGIWQGKEDLQ